MSEVVKTRSIVPDGYVNLLEVCDGQRDLARLYLYRFREMKHHENNEVLDGDDILLELESSHFLRVDYISDKENNTGENSVDLVLYSAIDKTYWCIDYNFFYPVLKGYNGFIKLYRVDGFKNKLTFSKVVESDVEYIRRYYNPSYKHETFFLALDRVKEKGRIPRFEFAENMDFVPFENFLDSILVSNKCFEDIKKFSINQVFELKPRAVSVDSSKDCIRFRVNSFSSDYLGAFGEVFNNIFVINDEKVADEFVIFLISILYFLRKEVEGVKSSDYREYTSDEVRCRWVDWLLGGLGGVDIFRLVRSEAIDQGKWLSSQDIWGNVVQSGLLDSLGWHFFSRGFLEGERRRTKALNLRLSIAETEDLANGAIGKALNLDSDSLSNLLDENSVFHRLMLVIERVSADARAAEQRLVTQPRIEAWLAEEFKKPEYKLPQTTFADNVVSPIAKIILGWIERHE